MSKKGKINVEVKDEQVQEEIAEEETVNEEAASNEVKSEAKEEQTEEVKNTDKANNKKPNKYKIRAMQLEEELKKQHEEYLRVRADMENTKRRIKEEAVKDRKYASQKIVGELIDPIDMLVKIVSSEAPSPEIANYLVGFKMIANQLLDILKNDGLQEIEALNKEFDPNCMQAMSTEINNDVEENTVLQVMQNGYMYKDRVLRPAMVVVSKKEEK